MWSARERTIIARTKPYLEGSYSVKVAVEELEDLLVLMTLMWISGESWKKQETKKGAQHLRPSAQMVQVNPWWSAARDGQAPKKVDGGRSWNSRELDGARWKKGVMEAVDGYLENCANVKVDIEFLERLIEPENLEISQRYILKYSTQE